jgi:subtilase family serine protease
MMRPAGLIGPYPHRKGCLVHRLSMISLSAVALVPVLAGATGASASSAPNSQAANHRFVRSCVAPTAGFAACHAIQNQTVLADGTVAPAVTPSGYGPTDLQAAYSLPSATAGTGQTVAIVDAYDDPRAESDLAVYRSTFALAACTTANGCFRKVNQSGGTKAPRANSGWAQEISLDLDMVSAACPNCHILLVEATSSSLTNLGTAVNTAAKLGATEISNSYGGNESSSDLSYDTTYFNHPGIPITVSSGDSGYGVQYPAASQYVTSVGGTALSKAANTRGWSESVWSNSATQGAGSGCSAYDPQQSWQSSVSNITSAPCAKRAVADVSAVADPNTGVAVYDTYGTSNGWLVFGGTSVASPLIAAVYALAGNGTTVTYGSSPYAHTSALNDVTTGQTAPCGTTLCAGSMGWDGPTGLGTPNGTAGF